MYLVYHVYHVYHVYNVYHVYPVLRVVYHFNHLLLIRHIHCHNQVFVLWFDIFMSDEFSSKLFAINASYYRLTMVDVFNDVLIHVTNGGKLSQPVFQTSRLVLTKEKL